METESGYRRRDRKPRLDRSVYGCSGYAVHLTLCTDKGRRLFEHHPELADMVRKVLSLTAEEKGVTLYAYCLMPDHLHFVAAVQPGGQNLIDFVWTLKTKTTWGAKGHISVPLWQRSMHDRVLRTPEEFRERCRYVVENPVRQGLAEDWRTYPWAWSSEEA